MKLLRANIRYKTILIRKSKEALSRSRTEGLQELFREQIARLKSERQALLERYNELKDNYVKNQKANPKRSQRKSKPVGTIAGNT